MTKCLFSLAISAVTLGCSAQHSIPPTPQPPANIIVTEEPIVAAQNLDEKGKYEGGADALAFFVSSNMQHPVDNMGRHITGIIYVEFVIEKDGTTSYASIGKGSSNDPRLTAEALRICKLIRFKTAAMQNGKPVRSKYTLPIEFVN